MSLLAMEMVNWAGRVSITMTFARLTYKGLAEPGRWQEADAEDVASAQLDDRQGVGCRSSTRNIGIGFLCF